MPPRGRGGKFSKPSRGGGKHFSRDLQPLDKEGNPLGMWRDPADKQESSDEESSEESSEEESEEDAGPSKAGEESLTREQRKELAKKRKAAAIARKQKKIPEAGDMPTDSEEDSDDDEDLPANPNHTSKAREMARAAVVPSGEDAPPAKKKGDENLSRREKEAIAAQQAKERYQKLHAEGKTDEAKADLARLKLIREQRDQAAARKQAEKEERDERERQNKEKLDKEDKKRADALGGGEKKKVASTKGKK